MSARKYHTKPNTGAHTHAHTHTGARRDDGLVKIDAETRRVSPSVIGEIAGADELTTTTTAARKDRKRFSRELRVRYATIRKEFSFLKKTFTTTRFG